MKSVLRSVALLATVLVLLAGCYHPATPTQPVITTNASSVTPSSSATTNYPSTTPVVSTVATGTLTVHFIDVGQGDAELIQTSNGAAMLIDGGDTDTGIFQYLKSHGITRLDIVVATHPHADHIGGLVQVLKSLPVAKVITNGQPTTTKTYENFLDAIAAAKAQYVEVKRGDTINLDNLVFDVLSPADTKGDDLNNNSIVLRLAYGKVSFLFEGDAQTDAESKMIFNMQASSAYPPPLSSTILKVGHHGSRTSSSPSFLAAVEPKVAIYSAAAGNMYGHPHPETLANLAAVGALVYGTDINGTVIITTDGSSFQVAPSKGQPRGPPSNQLTSLPIITPVLMTSLTPAIVPGAFRLDIVSVTSPVKPGANATLVAQTTPGASCSIMVIYKSGPSEARGLTTKMADSAGQVSWTWKVGTNTTPGVWSISVSASVGGQQTTKTTTFVVT